MKKYLLSVILALAGTTISQHVVATNGLWLEKKDGSKIGYLFDSTVSISYTTDSLVIRTVTNDNTAAQTVTVSHAFDDIKKVYFDNLATKIDDNVLNSLHQQVQLTSDGICISGFAAAAQVTVADLRGRLVMHRTTSADGSLTLSKSELPRGINIIKVDKTSIKFNNK